MGSAFSWKAAIGWSPIAVSGGRTVIVDAMRAKVNTAIGEGKEERVFDWDRAAAILREKTPKTAKAGLIEDAGSIAVIYQYGEMRIDYKARPYSVSKNGLTELG